MQCCRTLQWGDSLWAGRRDRPACKNISILLGALIALVRRTRMQEYIIPVASGMIAGECPAGVPIAHVSAAGAG